jgi:ribosome-associated heat shock protein Hsp15
MAKSDPRRPVEMDDGTSAERIRFDKWLWAARFYKTRGLASTAVLAGRVHVNGERVKASKPVRAGDVVDLTKGNERYTVTVTGLADKRGSAAVAQALYSESADSREQREQLALQRRVARVPGDDLGARPTKQARRRLDALRRGQRRSG